MLNYNYSKKYNAFTKKLWNPHKIPLSPLSGPCRSFLCNEKQAGPPDILPKSSCLLLILLFRLKRRYHCPSSVRSLTCGYHSPTRIVRTCIFSL